MTDEEARQQVERADAFIAAFRELIASSAVDPSSPCEAACLRGLERIAATVDAVDYMTYANLANLNTALRGGLLDLIEVQLMSVGGGPTLDFEDAAEFLARFQPAIDAALRRRLQLHMQRVHLLPVVKNWPLLRQRSGTRVLQAVQTALGNAEHCQLSRRDLRKIDGHLCPAAATFGAVSAKL